MVGRRTVLPFADMVASPPVAFAAFILAERKRCETIVRDAGMTVE